MRRIFVRPAVAKDADKFTEWSQSTPENLWDMDVAKYPSTATICAFDEDGPLVFMPVQAPLVLESLAIRPGASPLDVSYALQELIRFCVAQAFIKGSGEVLFICQNESTAELAKRHLFEELPYRMFRLKVNTLEKPVVKET